jgi:hypothetical protein
MREYCHMHLPDRSPATSYTAGYDVAGFCIHVNADSPDLLIAAQSLMGAFGVKSLPSPGWRLVARREDLDRDPKPFAELRAIWSGAIEPNLQAVNYAGPGLRRLELLGCGRLDIDLRERSAAMTLAPHSRAAVAQYFLMPLLCEGLIQAGHSPVHAACLEVSSAGQPRSVLIVAKSGTGKSTTALALANSGWKLLGDDLALICGGEGRLTAWGFPRMVHVRRPSLELLPWLNELPLQPHASRETFDLPLAALGERAGRPKFLPREPAAILILERPNSTEHRCQRIDRAVALAALAHENVQPIEGGEDVYAHTTFGRFAELVQQAPAYQLSVGPQLDSLARFLFEQTGVGHV